MSEFDAAAAKLLKGTVIPLITVLVLIALLLKNFKTLYKKFIVWSYLKLGTTVCKDVLTEHKEALFAPLANFKSLDWNLRNQGLVRILEIGIGPGSNFRYYPKNARVVAVEPNPHFKKSMDENRARFGHIKLEQLIEGEAENLVQVADGSVDISISTSVLCSVRDLKQVLNEIHRVLAPGGVHFFLEHVAWNERAPRWQRLAQRLADIVWPYIFDGCRTTRDVEQAIRAAGFENTKFKRFVITKLPKYFQIFVGPHVYGTAQKKRKSVL